MWVARAYLPVKSRHLLEIATNQNRLYKPERIGDFLKTNQGKTGLGSVDRNNKTTLLLTRRCGTNKSYAKDLSPRIVKLQDVG